MTITIRRMMVPVLFSVLTAAVMAQQAPNMALTRKNPSLSTLDQQNIAKWIEDETAKLFNSADPAADGPQYRTRIAEHLSAADATPGFKEQVGKSVAASLTKHYTGTVPPIAMVIPMTILDSVASPAGYDVYRKALADPAPAVRVAAACGLLTIRPKLNAQQAGDLLKDVQKAAEVETSPVALYRMYRLIAAEPDNSATAVAALQAIVDARLRRFEEKGELPLWADADAANLLGARAQAAPAARKLELVGYLAKLMAHAAHAYASGSLPPASKEYLERVIDAAERQLTDTTAKMAAGKQQPSIMKVLGSADKVNAELAKWIGSAQAAGYLNDAPFSMPRNLNIKWAAPATSSAPATAASR